MKKRTKGILAFAFLGGIMVTSTVVIAIPGIEPDRGDIDPFVRSVDPLNYNYSENYNPDDRVQFCGSGQPPGFTDYIREFEIPTKCTNPLAITVDYDGNPWFVESNTGMVATFDLESELFTEYPNPNWPEGVTSMMWGLDYASDGVLWFTDDWSNSVWLFNPLLGQYGRLSFPMVVEDPLPQRLAVDGSQIIINDLYGNLLAFLNPSMLDSFLVAPSPVDGAVLSDFVVDDNTGHIWYTSWSHHGADGYLVRFDYDRYVDIAANTGQVYLPPIDFVDLVKLPPQLLTPNGIAMSDDGKIWIAGTSSSSFFEFDPALRYFVQYVTADPMVSTYGNKTGVIKDPISRPYWMASDDMNRIVFNSQTSNNISVFDPVQQKLVEYHVPSKNPKWSDCTTLEDGADSDVYGFDQDGVLDSMNNERCGVAQVFDFDVHEDKIWFTEWAENKIGVVDTSVTLPFDVALSESFVMTSQGTDSIVTLEITGVRDGGGGDGDDNTDMMMDTAGAKTTHTDITTLDGDALSVFAIPAGPYASAAILDVAITGNNTAEYTVLVSLSSDAPSGFYKVLLGAQAPDVSVGSFVTLVAP